MFIKYHEQLLKKVLTSDREISSLLSYKNFEHQMMHSLDAEDFKLVISRRLLAELLEQLIKNRSRLSL